MIVTLTGIDAVVGALGFLALVFVSLSGCFNAWAAKQKWSAALWASAAFGWGLMTTTVMAQLL